jgi:phosphopantothenoylcysteine decarboxylase/phosphopantothenate--cysteine ligase
MHTEMWEHPATVENVATLRRYGALVVDPASGRLTGADTGPGRLPDPDELVRTARLVLERGAPPPRDLAGCTVVVTAGGTREYLDPVRFLGNRSSGKQGYAIARAAVLRGATVRLVTANVPLAAPSGAQITAVTSAQQLRDATLAAAKDADIVVMAAAVADFRPAQAAEYKIKKDGRDPAPVALVQNADVLVELAQQRREGVSPAAQVLVGFAAETGSPTASVLELGRAKLARKGADLLVVNEVGAGRGFETEENAGVILGRDGSETVLPIASKDLLAHALWDRVTAAG